MLFILKIAPDYRDSDVDDVKRDTNRRRISHSLNNQGSIREYTCTDKDCYRFDRPKSKRDHIEGAIAGLFRVTITHFLFNISFYRNRTGIRIS